MSGTVLSTLYLLTNLILTITPCGKFCYYLNFTDEEIAKKEARKCRAGFEDLGT